MTTPTMTPALQGAIARIAQENGWTVTAQAGGGQDRVTSPEVAVIAARGVKDPTALSPEEIKAVCASALTQA